MVMGLGFCIYAFCNFALDVCRYGDSKNALSMIISSISFHVINDNFRRFFQSIMYARCFNIRRRASTNEDVRPSWIRCQFQFTNAGRMPFTIRPNFCPNVIIIDVYPTQNMRLANESACNARDNCRRNEFFATASMDHFCDDRQDANASINQNVSCFFVTPIICFRRNVMRKRFFRAQRRFLARRFTYVVRIFVIRSSERCGITRCRIKGSNSP